jgi:NhaA family Na+:H+ antiporter
VGLKVFLAALAIVDDIGAVLVIAFFYTGAINWHAIQMSAVCLVVLIGLNAFRVRWLTPYLLVGAVLWFFIHESGIHATVAGVLLAFVIPVRTELDAGEYSAKARELLADFDRAETGDLAVITSKKQQEALFALETTSSYALAPLLKLEHSLHALSAFLVMPLFAFANAGVSLSGLSLDRVTLGVVIGLLIGKSFGITSASWLSVRSGAAALPEGVTWVSLHGAAWFGGIGFTMALFIATLAFGGTPLLDSAKEGILAASTVAALIGAVVVRAGLAGAARPPASRSI